MIDKRLTAQEVASKRFTPVRLREGYSMDEVDAFLDEVESTLSGQEAEIGELQEQVKRGVAGNGPKLPQQGSIPQELKEAHEDLAQARQRIEQLEGELSVARQQQATAPAPEVANSSLTEAAASATRMLEMAARQHDELISQGKSESEKLLSETQARIKAEEAAMAAKREQHLGQLDQERRQLENSITGLRKLEADSRNALHRHFTSKLEELKTSALERPTSSPPVQATPKSAPTPEQPPSEPSKSEEDKPAQAFPSFFDN